MSLGPGDYITRCNRWIGTTVAWLTGLMVAVTTVIVILRYVFDSGWIWLQETVTWMHAAVFLLAAAWTLQCGQHVRVDVFYRDMSPRRKALVDIAGAVLLLIPTCVFLLVLSWDYVATSWRIHESSPEAGGLPGLFILKSLIPLTAILLIFQGIAQVIAAIPRLGDESDGKGESS